MSVSVLIRRATDADLAAVGGVHHRSRTAAYQGLVSAAGLAAGSDAAMVEWWTERLRWERDTHRLSVAEVAGVVAGFSYAGASETPGAVELYAIHVEPALVGTGCGRALMRGALIDLAELADDPAPDAGHIGRAVLWVLTENARARRFYARGGWTADGATRDAPIGSELVAQVRYTRPLGVDPTS